MRIAMIGLGRMGANMTRRFLRGGHEVVAYDPSKDAVSAVVSEGAIAAGSLAEVKWPPERADRYELTVCRDGPVEGINDERARSTAPGRSREKG